MTHRPQKLLPESEAWSVAGVIPLKLWRSPPVASVTGFAFFIATCYFFQGHASVHEVFTKGVAPGCDKLGFLVRRARSLPLPLISRFFFSQLSNSRFMGLVESGIGIVSGMKKLCVYTTN
jgi:hypothetical protein